MPTRSALAALSAASLLATTIGVAAPASAVADCSVVDFTPQTITMGLGHTKPITFDVGTDCDEEEIVSWWLTFERPDQQYSYGSPLLANFEQEPSSRYTYIENGEYVWQRGDNTEAGARVVAIDAFTGDLDDGNFFSALVDFKVLHRTTFGSTFNASPEPRRKGQTININAKLSQANWDTDQYDGFGAWVMLQFKPENADAYQDVKWVWSNGVETKTTVIAKKTGTWRYRYPGDETTGASNSKGDTVIVKRAIKQRATP